MSIAYHHDMTNPYFINIKALVFPSPEPNILSESLDMELMYEKDIQVKRK